MAVPVRNTVVRSWIWTPRSALMRMKAPTGFDSSSLFMEPAQMAPDRSALASFSRMKGCPGDERHRQSGFIASVSQTRATSRPRTAAPRQRSSSRRCRSPNACVPSRSSGNAGPGDAEEMQRARVDVYEEEARFWPELVSRMSAEAFSQYQRQRRLQANFSVHAFPRHVGSLPLRPS